MTQARVILWLACDSHDAKNGRFFDERSTVTSECSSTHPRIAAFQPHQHPMHCTKKSLEVVDMAGHSSTSPCCPCGESQWLNACTPVQSPLGQRFHQGSTIRDNDVRFNRRRDLLALVSIGGLSLLASPATAATLEQNSLAALGMGPRDLFFPDVFEGHWKVESVLTKVELPFGEEAVPDLAVVERAQTEDLNKIVTYPIHFQKSENGSVILDRKYNTAALVEKYTGMDLEDVMRRIQWQASNPDHLEISLPGGLRVTSDVTRRSQELLSDDLLETSEFYQQLVDSAQMQNVRLKASRAYTKWRWREADGPAAGNVPTIVATQVISDFLSPYDQKATIVQSLGKPVTVYTYRMSLRRITVM